jgi:hypothetical protein
MGATFNGSGWFRRDSSFATGDNATMMAWCRPTALPGSGGYANVICNLNPGTGGTFGWGIDIHNATGTAKWSLGTQSNDFDATAGANPAVNTWFHVAAIRNGNTKTLYVNGVQAASNSDAVTTQTSFFLGSAFNNVAAVGSDLFTGTIAHAKVWKAVLTLNEIIQEMMQGRPVRTANLFGHWPLFNAGDFTVDYSGGGNTITSGGSGTAYGDGPPVPLYVPEARLIVAPAAGGGGTTFTYNLSESVGLADAVSRVASYGRSYSEALGSTDAINGARATYARAYSEAMGLSDALAKTLLKSLGETVGTTDAVVRQATFTRSLSEALGLTDTVTRQANFARPQASTVGMSDAVAFLRAIQVVFSEAMGMSDAVTRQATLVRTQAETVGLADALLRIAAYDRTTLETAGITDAFAVLKALVVNLSETVGTHDALTQASAIKRALSDGVNLADAVTRQANFARAFVDTMGLADQWAAGFVFLRQLSETVGTHDLVTKVGNFMRQQGDVVGATDSVTRLASYFRGLADICGVTDTVDTSAGVLRAAAFYYLLLIQQGANDEA